MKNRKEIIPLPEEVIIRKIFWIRGNKVMLDFDLAALYRVETKQLKRAVRRNINRFSPDFMLEIDAGEFENLRSQSGTSSWGGIRYQPMAYIKQAFGLQKSCPSSGMVVKVNASYPFLFTFTFQCHFYGKRRIPGLWLSLDYPDSVYIHGSCEPV